MDDMENRELKLLFIQEELSQHGEWLCDEFTAALEKQKLIESGDLEGSVNYSGFTSGDDPGLKVSFLTYGRAFEIAGARAKNKNQWSTDTNRAVWGIKENRVKKKNTRWYARNMYGGLNRLISRIMYGLSEVEIERLKGIIAERKMSLNNGES